MSKIGFLTDSCSDIPQELADKYGIEVVGFPINLDGNRLPVAQHSRKILHKLVRNLGDVDKTGLALRQRNERAERLDTSDLALDNIPNL